MSKSKNYFKTICNVSKAFGTTYDKKKLLDIIVDSAINIMDAKAVCLFLADERKNVFVPVTQKGLSEKYLHAEPTQAKIGVEDILTGGHIAIYDATSDPRVENQEAKKAEGIASILVVPVRVKEKAIGILSLYTSSPRKFMEDEIDFLGALAEQAGIAIENARLVERMRMNTEFFHDLAVNINSTLDVKKILQVMSADIAEILGVKGITIRLVDEESGTLKLVASFGLSEKYLNKGPFYYDKTTLEALKKRPVVTRDVAADDNVQYRKEKMEEGIVSILAVPIHARDDVIGVLKLYSDVPREFTEDDIMLVTAMAHQGGLAIQNASMYIRLQEDKKSLEEDVWSHRMWF
jgi:GAF domain-containing protein